METVVEIPIIDTKARIELRQHFQKQSYHIKTRKDLIPKFNRNLAHGWMMPILAQVDRCLWGRWDYWGRCQLIPAHAWNRWKMEPMLALLEGRKPEPLPEFVIHETLPNEPIPQIDWEYSSVAENMLNNTLNCVPKHGEWRSWSAWEYLEYFLDWALFGFGHPAYKSLPKEPASCEGASMRLYQVFDLSALLLYPEDYLGRILPDICGKKAQRNAGFYPTPLVVGSFISQVISAEKTDRTSSFNEPACGTGTLMLAQSNYCLCGIGQDIDPILLKCALFQFFLYAPWLAIPIWWLGQTDLWLGNTLLAEKPKSMNAVYWYEEWFESVENAEQEEKSEQVKCESFEIVEQTMQPETVIQEIVQGKRKPKKNTTSAKQMTLFNLEDFT
ncbi:MULTISPECIES: hypothetical protein [Oscillatoriales]|uniref:hypothetical protein n=1 Tax=Oscillatoriophycideae TaxID=1301283 RepID=UPI001F54EDEF|nr:MULTISPECIES: hypothetical protein [Oscillatoriales]